MLIRNRTGLSSRFASVKANAKFIKKLVSLCIIAFIVISFMTFVITMWNYVDPISDNPHDMTLLNAQGETTVSGYIRDGESIHHEFTAKLSRIGDLTEEDIKTINEYLTAQYNSNRGAIGPVCAAVDDTGKIDILYYDKNGNLRDLNDDIPELLKNDLQ